MWVTVVVGRSGILLERSSSQFLLKPNQIKLVVGAKSEVIRYPKSLSPESITGIGNLSKITFLKNSLNLGVLDHFCSLLGSSQRGYETNLVLASTGNPLA